ncbi:NAD(P)H-dependent oxidoreductase [Bacillus sp. PR5]|nr:NAD(P)H-dependent oxidoreductase [Bacillus sp. PR5]
MEGVDAIVFSSRGGVHVGHDSDAVTPYLRSVLGLMGITNVEFVYAEGMDVPQSRVLGIEAALKQVANLARHPMVCG